MASARRRPQARPLFPLFRCVSLTHGSQTYRRMLLLRSRRTASASPKAYVASSRVARRAVRHAHETLPLNAHFSPRLLAQGCNPDAQYSYQVTEKLWVCMMVRIGDAARCCPGLVASNALCVAGAAFALLPAREPTPCPRLDHPLRAEQRCRQVVGRHCYRLQPEWRLPSLQCARHVALWPTNGGRWQDEQGASA